MVIFSGSLQLLVSFVVGGSHTYSVLLKALKSLSVLPEVTFGIKIFCLIVIGKVLSICLECCKVSVPGSHV